VVWFRRDLRAEDHAALYHALKAARRVHAVFVFDREILDPLLARGLKADRRVEFMRGSLTDLDSQLLALGQTHGVAGAGLIALHGRARDEIPILANELHAQAVYANHDDEPEALARDAQVRGRLSQAGIALHTSKDHLIFERSEVMSAGETPLTAFEPYKDLWLKRLLPTSLLPERWRRGVPELADIGFESTNLQALKIIPGSAGAQALFEDFRHRIPSL
jgi:deoxyribodipyrimidine photo-lyase